MDIELVHEKPVEPKVKEVVLRLNPREAQDLLAMACIANLHEATRNTYICGQHVKTWSIESTAACLRLALKQFA